MLNPGKRKHHDRYAEGGVSCICLIAIDHLWGIERRRRQPGQKTTLSILMPFDGRKSRVEPAPFTRVRSQLGRDNAATRKSKVVKSKTRKQVPRMKKKLVPIEDTRQTPLSRLRCTGVEIEKEQRCVVYWKITTKIGSFHLQMGCHSFHR